MCFRCQDIYSVDENGRVIKEGSEKKKPKYNNNRVKVDGILFDSQGEANYYCQLKLRRKANDIMWFARQVEFILLDGDKPIRYKADFVVVENDGSSRVIDFKGVETPEFKLKRKLLESQYDLTLELVKS